VRANAFMLNIEIKPTPGHEAPRAAWWREPCAALWAGGSAAAAQLVPPEALAAHAAAPDLPRALLLDSLWPAGTWRAPGLRGGGHQPPLMDAALLAGNCMAGWRALCYTVNDAADAERLLAWASTA
jgi:glycerophosphoryl diester phosphodiesterase